MSKPIIGPTLRRLRTAQGLSQQSLAQKLGISTSYLNLIEHDQRGVTANLLFKLAKILDVDLDTLSGDQERDYAIKLREVFADPMLGIEDVPESETQAIAAAAPNAIRAILALHRAWQGAREDSDGITLPSGRKILLPIFPHPFQPFSEP
jgi:transcriptional regulator with XRE-family HTH domain